MPRVALGIEYDGSAYAGWHHIAADMNCSVPTLGATCAAHGTLLVPVSDLVGIDGAETPVVFDPAYVNIVVNGHEPMVGTALIAAAHEPAAQEKARAAGAKGLRIVGSIETGQELVQRFEVDDVFVGLTGNWLNEELAVATGGLDVFAADMNCVVPTLADTCQKHGCLLIPVSDLVGVPGQEEGVIFDAEKARMPSPGTSRPNTWSRTA